MIHLTTTTLLIDHSNQYSQLCPDKTQLRFQLFVSPKRLQQAVGKTRSQTLLAPFY